MNNPRLNHVCLVCHQDDRLLPELQLGDLLEDRVRHPHGTVVVKSTDYNKPLWVVPIDQPLQLAQNSLRHSQKIFLLQFTEISP